MPTAIVLFTRDLRVHDNPALLAAWASGAAVVPLFVLDQAILGSRFNSPNRAAFLCAALRELDDQLRGRGGRLVLRRGDVAAEVARLGRETHATSVHLAADVSRYSARRERALRARLETHGCPLHVHSGAVAVVDPGRVRPSTGQDHFSVFTPYFRRWLAARSRPPLPAPDGLAVPDASSLPLPEPADLCDGDPSPELSLGGETTGRELLDDWLADGLADYHHRQDDLAADGTSRLSPYLHFGCLSATELVHRADSERDVDGQFVRQLAWRDFHQQVLAARPDAARRDLRPRGNRWRTDPQAFEAWRTGHTGIPVVDAAMRQLRAEGWMPGRARLIAASYLTKTLGLDWRAGAAHFLHWLVDGDVANNQLNWQWAAGTGTDTRPNRVLNPLRQAERHDPRGDYVRRWVPELAHLPGPAIHAPWKHGVAAAVYPPPLTDRHQGGQPELFATTR